MTLSKTGQIIEIRENEVIIMLADGVSVARTKQGRQSRIGRFSAPREFVSQMVKNGDLVVLVLFDELSSMWAVDPRSELLGLFKDDSMKHIRTSEILQSHFNDSNQDEMKKEADLVITLDVIDCDDSVGDQLFGIDSGIELWSKVLGVRKIKGNEDAGIYKLTFADYGDDDGIALFIGTEEDLSALFLANPSVVLSDSDRQDLDDGGDEI